MTTSEQNPAEIAKTSPSTEEIAALTAVAEGYQPEVFQDVPIELVELGSKLGKLVGNTDEAKFAKVRNQAYKLGLKLPFYVKDLSLTTEGAPAGKQFVVSWASIASGRKVVRNVSVGTNVVKIGVNDVIRELEILPPDKLLFGSIVIKSIRMVGVNQVEFIAKLERLGSIEESRSRLTGASQALKQEQKERVSQIASFEEQKTRLLAELEAARDQIGDQSGQIDGQRNQLASIESAIQASLDRQASLDARASATEKEINEKQGIAKDLGQQIASDQNKLRELKSDIDLFPTEIRGFAKEGGVWSQRYLLLAFLPIFLIGMLSWDLLTNSKQLANSSLEGWTLLEALVLRIPHVAIVLSLIGAFYKLAKVFASEIIGISRQRLNLTKLSIVSKDVSDASAADLDIDASTTYENRTYLKMALLKEHLRGDISSDFEYRKRSAADDAPQKS